MEAALAVARCSRFARGGWAGVSDWQGRVVPCAFTRMRSETPVGSHCWAEPRRFFPPAGRGARLPEGSELFPWPFARCLQSVRDCAGDRD